MESVTGWVIATILLGILAYEIGRRRASLKSSMPPPDLKEPASPAATEPPPQSIYSIAEQVSDFYRNAAQPEDLLQHGPFRAGVELLKERRFTSDDLLGYLTGDNGVIACMAGRALVEGSLSPEEAGKVVDRLNSVSGWALYFALEFLNSRVAPSEDLVGKVLKQVNDEWDARYPRQFLREFIKKRKQGGEATTLGSDLRGLSEESRDTLERLLRNLGEIAANLLEEARRLRLDTLDLDFLRSIGMVWTVPSSLAIESIVDHASLRELTTQLESALLGERPRSVVLVGETGVGKSTVAKVLARRLADRGWTLFEAGHAELVAGKMYLGQFEEQLQKLIRQLRGRSRVLWIVPAIHTLALAGRHKYSPVSALDMILPHVEQGNLILLGESNPSAFERLAAGKPRCATAFEIVRMEALSEDETIALGEAWASRNLEIGETPGPFVREAAQLAQQFLGFKARPGGLLELLSLTRQRLSGGDGNVRVRIKSDDLITTLSQITGLPDMLLDDRIGLDLEALRSLFNQRVIGQPEAVNCLVERAAMIKAGVTDPTRPYGVFLFAGPTGTGKTEIAKTLAQFLFGSSDRMIRLDMSEFQSLESLDRVLGTTDPDLTDALVDRVRKQPFSVVLLDEFEKAHERIWDVFLQAFDDGRLTDRRGNTADFRHAIFILTSNLGAAIPSGTSLGFSKEHGEFKSGAVTRAVGKAFRKEFLNRLDRVVVFQPLTLEIMRRILQKELVEAFQRRGLRTRSWEVEWDESAIEFLLARGFTADLGARPLKRAIDRYLLSPLAVTIVNRQVPEGDQFLFVRGEGEGLRVDFVDPDVAVKAESAVPELHAGESGGEPQTPVEAIILNPAGSWQEIHFLHGRYERLKGMVESREWSDKKRSALAMMDLPDFWASSDRFEILGQYECQDRIEASMQRAGSLLRRLAGRGPSRHRDRYPRELVSTLAHSLYLLEAACKDVMDNRPLEAFLVVQTGEDPQDTREKEGFARELVGMYEAWAKRRGMRWEILEEGILPSGNPLRLLASISGYGAFSILAPEDGLHTFEFPDSAGKVFGRCKIQVRVLAQSAVTAGRDSPQWKQQIEALLQARDHSPPRIVRRYRRRPSPLVRDSVRGWRTGNIDQVLGGNFDLITET
jgi:ATP-dependent Clp protease ATP-binding subunit ClpC